MDKIYDVIIIGSGPGGLAAAVTGDNLGLNILVVDEQPEPGGQIYRSMERSRPENVDVLGKDYFAGKRVSYDLTPLRYWSDGRWSCS